MYDDVHEIIKDFLWLGNSYAACDKEDLKKKGIKKVLSVWDSNGPKYNDNEFIHKKVKVADVYTFNIIPINVIIISSFIQKKNIYKSSKIIWE